MRCTAQTALLACVAMLVLTTARAEPTAIAELNRTTPVDFSQEVLPLLKRNCLACHNAMTAESDLNLETPASILQGGASGPAATPGAGVDSLLVQHASGLSEPIMPPKDNKVAARLLTPEELGLLKLWIDQGATGEVSQISDIQWQPLPPGVNPVFAVALSPDGQFAACGRANQIFIYQVPTGRLVCRLTDPELLASGLYSQPGVADLDLIQSLAFSPDGTLLASGGYRTVKLWRRPQNVRPLSLESLAGDVVKAVAVSSDGHWLAAGSADMTIRLIDLAGQRPALTLAGHAGPVTSVTFSADCTQVISGSLDQSVRCWNTSDGTLTSRIDTPHAINALALVADGQLLATGGADNKIRLWQLAAPGATAPSLAAPLAGLPSPTQRVAVSSDRKLLAAAGADGAIVVVDLTGAQPPLQLTGHAGPLTALAFQQGAPRQVSAGEDGSVRIWNAANGQAESVLFPSLAPVTGAVLSPDGTLVAAGSADGHVRLFRTQVPAARPLQGEDEQPASVSAVSADGRYVATATTSGGQPAVVIREVASGAVVRTLVGHTAAVGAVALTADGSRVVSGGADNQVLVWNLADGAPLGKFAAHAQPVTAVAFFAGGQQVVSGTSNGELKLWNVADGLEVKAFAGHSGAISALCVPASNQAIVSGSADQTIRIWNPADGAQVRAISPGQAVTALALSRDDQRVCAATADNKVQVFQFADGALKSTLLGHTAVVKFVGFSPAGLRVVTGGTDNRAIMWETETGALLEVRPVAGTLTAAGFSAAENELILGADKALAVHTLAFERLLPGNGQAITDVEYRPNGSLVYAAAADGSLRAFRPGDGQQQWAQSLGQPIHDLAVSADSQWVATASQDAFARVWNAENGGGAPAPQLAGFTGPVRSVCFSADSLRLIAAGEQPQESFVYSLMTGETVQADRTGAAGARGLFLLGETGTQALSLTADGAVHAWPLAAGGILVGHGQPVTALAAIPTNAQLLLSGGADNQLREWNVQNLQSTRSFDHGGPIAGIAVRPDGKRFATVGANNIARLWNAENNQMLAELRGDLRAQAQVVRVQREIDLAKTKVQTLTQGVTEAEQRVTAETDAVKKAMDARPPAEQALAEKTEAARVALEATTAAQTVLAEAEAALKTAQDALTAAQEALTAAEAAATAANDAAAQAKAAADGDPNNVDLANQAAAAAQAATDAQTALTTAQQNKTAAEQAVADQTTKVKAATDDLTAKTKASDDAEAARRQAETVKNSADKSYEAAMAALERAKLSVEQAKADLAGATAAVAQAEAQLPPTQQAAQATEKPVLACAFSPDNLTLATCGDDQLVHLWSAETGQALDILQGHVGAITALSFTPEGLLASASADKSVYVWDVNPAWTWERTIGGPQSSVFVDRVTALDFSPDGALLASGGGEPSRSGELKLWNVADGALVRDFPQAHSDSIFCVDFSRDGRFLASSGADKFVKVHEAATGTFVRSFEGHTHHVLGVAWRADGRVLASCGADNVIKVWDFITGDQRTTIAGFNKEVTAIAFIGDSPNTVSCSGDATVRFHNVDNGGNYRNFSGAADFVYGAAATWDGKMVIAAGQDSVLRVWNGESGQQLQAFAPPAPPAEENAEAVAPSGG